MYVAFLRGVNVGRYNVVHKEDLLNALAPLGYQDVSVYKQSGNIMFQTTQTDQDTIQKELQKAVHSILNKDIQILLRPLPHLQELINNNPFKNEDSENSSFLVTFLSTETQNPPQTPLSIPKSTAKVIKITKTEAYSITHGGGEGALPNPFLEKTLKTPATTRNYNTIKEITQKHTNQT